MFDVVLIISDVMVGYVLDLLILCEVLFVVECGKVMVIIGLNGVGKLILIKVVFGLLLVMSGMIVVDGMDVIGLMFDCMIQVGIVYVLQIDNVFWIFMIQ